MCLIVLAYKQRDDYPLLLAGNRDEFYARPAAPLDWWQDHKQILAGRDLTAGGTWFGVTQGGKFAAVTNYREPGKEQQGKKSRGALVQNFLASDTPTAAYAQELVAAAVDYNGFNLVFPIPRCRRKTARRRTVSPARRARSRHGTSIGIFHLQPSRC